MSALISYVCTCGHRFLIGVSVDAPIRRAGLAAAEALGATYVDRGVRRFACHECERIHVRRDVGELAPAVSADLVPRR